VLFDFDRAVVRSDAQPALDDLANRIRSIDLGRVSAIGYSDRIGATAYNQGLSERRADAVKAYLISKGVDGSRMVAEGRGETQPVTGDQCRKMGREDQTNKKLIACLQPDRRVDVEIQGMTAQ
jgi:OOP family OmpA-OmpF porin